MAAAARNHHDHPESDSEARGLADEGPTVMEEQPMHFTHNQTCQRERTATRHSRTPLPALLLAALVGAGVATAATAPATTRINCGGGVYTDQAGNPWIADAYSDGGAVQATASAITGTPNPTLYQSQRIGPTAYRLPIANGMVEVVLHFAELSAQSSNSRVFDISIDGTLVVDNVDIFRETGGRFRALTKTVRAFVNDGTMDLLFTGVVGTPAIAAIDAKPIPSLDSSPPTIDFGDVALGFSSAEQRIVMVNIGSLTVHVTNIRFVGANPADFQTVDFCAINLEPGASAPAYAIFAPTDVGERSASLVIDLDNAQHYVPVSGRAVSAAPNTTAADTLAASISSPWSNALDVGCGWLWLSWFGYFIDDTPGWIFHQNLGRLYTPSTSDTDLWLWSPDMGWLWTRSTIYPSLYSASSGGWLWYKPESANPRVFYNFTTGRWESH